MKIDSKHKIQEVAGEHIVMLQGTYGVDTTKVLSFNATSLWLWKNFEQKEFSLEDVKAAIIEQFEVDEQVAAADAQKWVDTLSSYNLLAE